jgi:membrane protein
LLALVPLLAVIFGIIAAFPVFAHWSDQLKSFIFTNFLPASGQQVEAYLNTFLASTSSLALPGTVFLIITALMLMFSIEVAFNRIWRVDRSRSLMNRIVMYWAVLTLGPLLMGAAIAMSVQNFIDPVTLENSVGIIGQKAGVFLLSWIAFTLMFVLVPNRKVFLRDALAGALLSAVLFELAKIGFVTYVSHANFTVIYGALATIPIFLFWLYLVWIVILFGASLAASLTTFADSERARSVWPARLDFQLAYRLVGHLWRTQRSGENLSDMQLLLLEPQCNERQMQHVLHQLEEARIVARDEEADWRLARDLGELTLSELYCSGSFHLPIVSEEPVAIDSPWDQVFSMVLQEVQEQGLVRLDRPLRGMYLETTTVEKTP